MSDILWEHESRNLVEKKQVIHLLSGPNETVIAVLFAHLGGQAKVVHISNLGDNVNTRFYSIREARAIVEAFDDWIGGGPSHED